jgi:hypothetical protein
MAPINQDAWRVIQPGLIAGESICWAGQPNTSVIFHKDDAFLIPVSLLWGGFMMFWEAVVAGPFRSHGPWVFGMLFGIPFVVYAQFLIWGRFLYAAWKKKRTFYAVTTRRVIVVQQVWRRQTASADIETLPTLTREKGSNGTGTLRFAKWEIEHPGAQQLGWTRFDVMALGIVPTFVDIDNVDSVYQMVSDLREKVRAQRTGPEISPTNREHSEVPANRITWKGGFTKFAPPVNQNAWTVIQPDLLPGESICWAGRPNTGVIFHDDDLSLIPASFFFGGIAMYWEALTAGFFGANPWLPGALFGIPLALAGQFLIWGRFLYAAWKKKGTFYAVTTRRVIVVQHGWQRQTASTYIDSLPTLTLENCSSSKGTGTLRFAQWEVEHPGSVPYGWTKWDLMAIGSVPSFMDIDNVDSVFQLVSDLREKECAPRTGPD